MAARLAAAAVLVALLLGSAPPSAALELDAAPTRTTQHFRFYGDPDVRAAIDGLAEDAERTFQRVCGQIGACARNQQPIDIWVAEDAERFASAFPDGAPMAEWAAGVTFIGKRRVVLRAHGSALFSLRETFDHELSHVLVHGLAGHSAPRWLSEGVAIWQSGEGVIDRLQTAQSAALTGNLLSFDELNRRFPGKGPKVGVAYAQSALFVRYLLREYGAGSIAALLHDLGRGEPFDDAFRKRFGGSPTAVAAAWTSEFEQDSSALLLFRDGTFFWILMTLLFVAVAFYQRRERRSAIEAMGDAEDAELAFDELQAQRDAGEAPTVH